MSRVWDNITLGSTVKEIERLIISGDNSNANMSKNPEALHKYTADGGTTKYALLKLLEGEESDKHLEADIHIHDLEFMPFRPLNCLQHDLRFFIENGLKVDGTGLHTSSARPAKNLVTLVNHIGQILGAGQVNMSGGQSIPFINTFLAPYCKSLTFKEVKQAIQMLIFNINMSYVSRGGQSVFSSFNVDLEMPEFLKDEPAWIGGTTSGVYGDYEEEFKLVAHLIIEVLMEGDGNGKPHLFPNTIFQLNDKVNLDEWDDLFELSAKYSLPYFNKPIDGNYSLVMGCRTRLATNWTGNWEQDLLRTGNLAYISLNLPKYALQYTGKDKRDLIQIIKRNLDVASNILLKRRKHGEDCLNKYHLNSFLSQKGSDGKPYYRIENSTLSFGIVGLYEAVEILNGGKYNQEMAIAILEYINEYAQKKTKETGYRWTVIGSPAESCAGKFGISNKNLFGKRANVKGTTGGYYYTNSSHYPVDSDVGLIDRIRGETEFHKLTQGGHIMNIFMGERWLDPGGLKSLTRKVYDNTDVGFWTYSSIYCICKKCNTQFAGVLNECNRCESDDIEIYDRITGYIQKVSGWNTSKQVEFDNRYRY